ncbi:MAG: RHS repeat-associated core domain-containing protein [Opitutales bacterium]|nr:RHS repeat-associated core domain-containing protein [Opitutales bacterium]
MSYYSCASSNFNPSASLAISVLYEFNDLNQRTKMTREDNSYWSYDYDDLGQVTDATKRDESGSEIPSFDFEFKYDDIGNRKSATRRNTGNDEDVVKSYTPNLLNQYSERSVPNLIDVVGSANANAQVLVNGKQATRSGDLFHQQLVVDNTDASQWLDVDVIAHDSVAGTYRKESGNQFLPKSPVEPQHDEDGNLTQDGRWSYTWDGENRLIVMETLATAVIAGVLQQKLEFAYDGQSRRIQKKVLGWTGSSWMPDQDTRFIWDGWNLIAELDALDTYNATHTYVWGLDLSGSMQGAGGVGGLLFAETATGSSIPAYDGNDNVLAYVDASSGVTQAEYEYGVFGESLRTEGKTADDFNFQFSTKYVDAETRLYYYGYRFYDAELGRWLNRDPLGEEGGVNLYGFVGNDAVKHVDVLGRQSMYAMIADLLQKTLAEYDRMLQFVSAQKPTVNSMLVPLDWLKKLCQDKDGEAFVEHFAAGKNIAVMTDLVAAGFPPYVGGFNFKGDMAVSNNLGWLHNAFVNKFGYKGTADQLQFAILYEEGIESINVSKDWVINNSPQNSSGYPGSAVNQAASEMLTDIFLTSVGEPARLPTLVSKGFNGYLTWRGPPKARKVSQTKAAKQAKKNKGQSGQKSGYGLQATGKNLRDALNNGSLLWGWDCDRVCNKTLNQAYEIHK